MIFSVYSLCSFLLLPPPSSLIRNRYLFEQFEQFCVWLLGTISFTAAGARSAQRPSRLHLSAKLVGALRQCLPSSKAVLSGISDVERHLTKHSGQQPRSQSPDSPSLMSADVPPTRRSAEFRRGMERLLR